MSVMDILKDSVKRARAESKGVALSHARLIKAASDIPRLQKVLEAHTHHGPKVAEPTDVNVRMLDGKPMTFFTDGSIRHALGSNTSKAARKALKRARRAKR